MALCLPEMTEWVLTCPLPIEREERDLRSPWPLKRKERALMGP